MKTTELKCCSLTSDGTEFTYKLSKKENGQLARDLEKLVKQEKTKKATKKPQ